MHQFLSLSATARLGGGRIGRARNSKLCKLQIPQRVVEPEYSEDYFVLPSRTRQRTRESSVLERCWARVLEVFVALVSILQIWPPTTGVREPAAGLFWCCACSWLKHSIYLVRITRDDMALRGLTRGRVVDQIVLRRRSHPSFREQSVQRQHTNPICLLGVAIRMCTFRQTAAGHRAHIGLQYCFELGRGVEGRQNHGVRLRAGDGQGRSGTLPVQPRRSIEPVLRRAKEVVKSGYVAEWIVDNLPGATSFVTVDKSRKYYASGFKMGYEEMDFATGQTPVLPEQPRHALSFKLPTSAPGR